MSSTNQEVEVDIRENINNEILSFLLNSLRGKHSAEFDLHTVMEQETAVEDSMGLSSNPKKPPHQPSMSRHGGFRTMPFIIGDLLARSKFPLFFLFLFLLGGMV